MKNIVLATYGGASADGAAMAASLLAARLQVPLIPVVVYAPIRAVDYVFGASDVPPPEDESAMKAALVASVTDQLRRCGVSSPSTVRTGNIPREIAATARALGAGLIVTGLGPHRPVDRALGGETALYLAQDATAPVLAMPASATTIPRRVIAAIDFSATSVHAARTAAGWLRAGDELHLVSVGPKPPHAEAARPADASLLARLTKIGEQIGVAAGVRVDAIELSGDPARTLRDHARRIGADLIALGSHGYGVVKRLVLGSVASKIIRVATCAVLVAPIGCLEA